jgi:hypothetical protein
MKNEVSLQCKQELSIGSFPEPDESSPHPHTAGLLILRSILRTTQKK